MFHVFIYPSPHIEPVMQFSTWAGILVLIETACTHTHGYKWAPTPTLPAQTKFRVCQM